MSDDRILAIAHRVIDEQRIATADEVVALCRWVLDRQSPWSSAHFPPHAPYPATGEDDLVEGDAD